jgi:hypothetical protein
MINTTNKILYGTSFEGVPEVTGIPEGAELLFVEMQAASFPIAVIRRGPCLEVWTLELKGGGMSLQFPQRQIRFSDEAAFLLNAENAFELFARLEIFRQQRRQAVMTK